MGWVYEYLMDELNNEIYSILERLLPGNRYCAEFDKDTNYRLEYGSGDPTEGHFTGTGNLADKNKNDKYIGTLDIEYSVVASLERDSITGPYIDYHIKKVKIVNIGKLIDSLTPKQTAKIIGRN